jgi:peptide chain release factor subunit 1
VRFTCLSALANVLTFVVLARRYFDEISQDTGKYCFGVEDTLQCLDMGAVETLIVWENLEVRCPVSTASCGALTCPARAALQVNRHVLINHTTNETFVKQLTPEQEKDTSHFVDKETGSARPGKV